MGTRRASKLNNKERFNYKQFLHKGIDNATRSYISDIHRRNKEQYL